MLKNAKSKFRDLNKTLINLCLPKVIIWFIVLLLLLYF